MSSTTPSRHFVTGDPLPRIRDDSIVLFGMAYCTFVQRVALVMRAKDVKYDIININVDQKPEFFTKRNPKQSCVPTIDRGGQVVWESEVICNLLEEWYPDVRLHPKDPYLKAKDQLVVAMFNDKVIPSFLGVLGLREEESNEEVAQKVEAFTKNITEFAEELKTRGDDKPGMVDFLTWPWVEKLLFLDRITEVADSIPVLKTYMDNMLELKIVKDLLVKKEHYQAFARSFALGKPWKYDF